MLATTVVTALLLAAPAASGERPDPYPVRGGGHDGSTIALLHSLRTDRPGIRMWTTHDEVYRRGERARIYFRTERDAFVTVFRVDTDGRVRILFPSDPWEDNFVRGGGSYMVSSLRRGEAFMVDDDPGVGYVFGIAANDPFSYGAIAGSEHWEVSRVGDRIHGDPFGSLMDIVDHLLPAEYADYDTHLLPYYVERRYDYPRFVCYDCHSYVGFSYWNPYTFSCSRYSLNVYSDPFYYYPSYWYPTRYYGGTRVVYTRPRGNAYVGRFVFKDRSQPTQPPIVYRRRDDVASNTPAERGVRGRDIGGVGTVPVPGSGGRRIAPVEGAPTEPPIIRGENAGRRPVVDPGVTPQRRETVQPGQPGSQGSEPARRGVERRPDQPGTVTPGADEPARRGVERRTDQPMAQPREKQPGADDGRRGVARPADPGTYEPARRGINTQPPAERPREEPRAQPERREQPRPEPRAQPAREPESRPQSQPRAEPQRQPESRPEPPRAEPRQSSPPPSPEPRLERRRPEN